LITIVSNAHRPTEDFFPIDNMTPTDMRLCGFCGSLVPEAQYIKHHQEMSRKGGQALRGSAAAYKKARNAARARWSTPQTDEEMTKAIRMPDVSAS
jgi:hypothetical protein